LLDLLLLESAQQQAVFLQMPLVVFKCARDVRVLLENIERPIIRENVVAAEFVVRRDVEEQVVPPLAAV